jgi:hypothetical protein
VIDKSRRMSKGQRQCTVQGASIDKRKNEKTMFIGKMRPIGKLCNAGMWIVGGGSGI